MVYNAVATKRNLMHMEKEALIDLVVEADREKDAANIELSQLQNQLKHLNRSGQNIDILKEKYNEILEDRKKLSTELKEAKALILSYKRVSKHLISK